MELTVHHNFDEAGLEWYLRWSYLCDKGSYDLFFFFFLREQNGNWQVNFTICFYIVIIKYLLST